MYTIHKKEPDYKKRAPHGPTGNILKITQLRVLGLVRTKTT